MTRCPECRRASHICGESWRAWDTRVSAITGQILQISISRGGIPKLPVAEAYLTPTGIEGDAWAHPQFHGGPRKAVLLIMSESLEELRSQGFSVYAGDLGENFTTVGLDRHEIRVGNRYRVGPTAVIEITKLRVPCDTLDKFNEPGLPRIQDALYDPRVKAGDASSPRWGMGGFYASVVGEGPVHVDDRISILDILA